MNLRSGKTKHAYIGVKIALSLFMLVQNFNRTMGAEQNIVVESYAYDGVSQLATAEELSASGVAGSATMPSIFAS